jgi:MFS family permease
MAYALVYCLHTLEMSALRGWCVVFLGFVAAGAGGGAPFLAPTVVATALALVGVAASVLGNETAIRFGRRRLIVAALLGSIAVGAAIGFLAPLAYELAVALMLLYGLVVWLDSSSLTAGAAGTADPARRGATLAVHSMLGYAGGMVGPVLIGVTLDLAGGPSPKAWGLAFALVAACMALALLLFWRLRPRGLAGDRTG